ncbi:MAG: hypothetical protein OQL20_01010 [Sedimenticola sp.]|nr:hypothetical protein [Sedimenticola sp.]
MFIALHIYTIATRIETFEAKHLPGWLISNRPNLRSVAQQVRFVSLE